MDINGLLSTIGSLRSIGKAFIEERDRQKLTSLQTNLSEGIIKAQAQVLDILSAVTEKERRIQILEQRIRELETQQAEKARYRLTKLGTVGEFFAYVLCDSPESLKGGADAEHFLCQPCFDSGKHIVLIGNGDGYWGCPVCKVGARVTPDTFNYECLSKRDRGGW